MHESGKLYAFDGRSGLVSVFGLEGEVVATFGGIGRGPGEVEEPGTAFAHNSIALLGDHVVLNELGFLHLFDSQGTFIDRFRTDQYAEGPFADLHVAALSDSTLLFALNGAPPFLEASAELKAGLRLIQLRVDGGDLDTLHLGWHRNRLVRQLPFERYPPRDPYGSWYHRSWDAIPSGVLVITSWSGHGVCFFDSHGDLLSGVRIEAPVVVVDEEEKRSVLARMREEYGERAPFTGEAWEEFYERWPSTLPHYVDVALAPDGTAWLERPIAGGERMWDLVHHAQGYRGSLPALGEGAPLAFAVDCVVVITLDTGDVSTPEDDYYGLTRWCPELPGASQSEFNGR